MTIIIFPLLSSYITKRKELLLKKLFYIVLLYTMFRYDYEDYKKFLEDCKYDVENQNNYRKYVNMIVNAMPDHVFDTFEKNTMCYEYLPTRTHIYYHFIRSPYRLFLYISNYHKIDFVPSLGQLAFNKLSNIENYELRNLPIIFNDYSKVDAEYDFLD